MVSQSLVFFQTAKAFPTTLTFLSPHVCQKSIRFSQRPQLLIPNVSCNTSVSHFKLPTNTSDTDNRRRAFDFLIVEFSRRRTGRKFPNHRSFRLFLTHDRPTNVTFTFDAFSVPTRPIGLRRRRFIPSSIRISSATATSLGFLSFLRQEYEDRILQTWQRHCRREKEEKERGCTASSARIFAMQCRRNEMQQLVLSKVRRRWRRDEEDVSSKRWHRGVRLTTRGTSWNLLASASIA
jgi:hypothetical protein